MEEVAHPYFINQALPGTRFHEPTTMPKKRDLPWLNPNQNYHHQQPQQRFQNPNSNNWNSNGWDWDSVRFVAKPAESEVQYLGPPAKDSQPQAKKKNSVEEDGENLTLKLGGGLYAGEEPPARPSKRVRSGSPGSNGNANGSGDRNRPMCQVDDCKRDLLSAKDYHRRHKVCEVHSKTTKALVGNQMQRFCQQCSRFHLLSEFDEGKRSCRRRLAGHNRRRRKTQPEEVSSQAPPGNQEGAVGGNLDIVNLLTVLAQLQGNTASRPMASVGPLPDKDQLIQILNKISATNASAAKLPAQGGLDLNVSQEQPNKSTGHTSHQSPKDLCAVLSAAGALAGLSQRGGQMGDMNKTKLNFVDKGSAFHIQKEVNSSIADGRTTKFQPHDQGSNCQVQEPYQSLPFQLFSSSPEEDRPPNLRSSRKYFSSDSSSPMEETSPSSSPPVVQKFFPVPAAESMKHESLSASGEDNGIIETSTTQGGWSSRLGIFGKSKGRVENRLVQNRTYQAGYTSSSGSDHSPSSSNSDVQDRTGRIIFKLFDKDPSHLPATLRTQILNWLSHSPSEMESYIRPGCVVLSIYIAMPAATWEQLQADFLQRVKLLVEDSDSSLWRNGRFLVHTDRQLASHKDGKIRLCKSWRRWSGPELISVSPVAVAPGQETSLVLRGRNLTLSGTKIYCTYMGKYVSKKIIGSAGTASDNIRLESFTVPSQSPQFLGRCFVEVENGFKGSNFPVIIADTSICEELRILESELEDARVDGIVVEDQVEGFGHPRSREEAVHFLNELGWLFQKNNNSSHDVGPDFSVTRFRFLLTFSVERDWCALVKSLLDIFVASNLIGQALLPQSVDMLNDVHLLNRAVKRKSKNMVNLLVQYSHSTTTDSTRTYLFSPNQKGPGDITPLHLAACALDSENIVDALTNDPQEIGLNSWISLRDANGHSPYDYASTRGNHGYNKMVAQKFADRKNGQVSISIEDDMSLQAGQSNRSSSQPVQRKRSCAKCAVVATRLYKPVTGATSLLFRPYVYPMLAIAAVCVCVCLFLRGSPDIGRVAPFKWENLKFGPS